MSYMTRDEAEAMPQPSSFPSSGAYVGALLMPLLGVIFAIVAFGKGKVGPGFALLLTSGLAWIVYILVALTLAANNA